MKRVITYKTEISSSHHLPDTPELCTKKCHNPHGHNYLISIAIAGEINRAGMIIDYGFIKHIIDTLDHQDLNDYVTPSTAEEIAQYLYEGIRDLFQQDGEMNSPYHFVLVKVKETSKTAAYYGDESLVSFLE